VTIEGHCSEDEGAREDEVRHALSKADKADNRIRTVNYGNTRPAVSGESETAPPKSTSSPITELRLCRLKARCTAQDRDANGAIELDEL
jgi:outer membrane protein OmpA-like peptidoglycan-associated protein